MLVGARIPPETVMV